MRRTCQHASVKLQVSMHNYLYPPIEILADPCGRQHVRPSLPFPWRSSLGGHPGEAATVPKALDSHHDPITTSPPKCSGPREAAVLREATAEEQGHQQIAVLKGHQSTMEHLVVSRPSVGTRWFCSRNLKLAAKGKPMPRPTCSYMVVFLGSLSFSCPSKLLF